jgi:predicted nucleic-acid-binding Zn-ribbon protein
MIHHQDCGDCKSGHGKRDSLSNKNGFWAGPFNTINDTEDSLNKLLNLVEDKFTFRTCRRCIKL